MKPCKHILDDNCLRDENDYCPPDIGTYSITEVCLHPNKATKVLEHIFICEITVTVCIDCGIELDEPKTDC
jgi:hypothetical protein